MVGANDTLLITGGSTKTLNERTIAVSGLVTYSGSGLTSTSSPTAGTVDIQTGMLEIDGVQF
ncbi:MAG: hypothetical protein ACE5FJ_09105 [Gemmatimonadales bacterium]